MFPLLYDKNTILGDPKRYNNHNGYGFFNRCSKCEASEGSDGEYTLDMEVLPDDRLIDVVTPGMYIKVKANHNHQPQLFCINDVDISKNYITSIKASHIKSQFFNNILSPYTFTEVGAIMTGSIYEIVDNLVEYARLKRIYTDSDGVFHLSQRIIVDGFDNTQKTLSLDRDKPLLFQDIFFGDGGVLDTFGGEFKYDNEKIYLLKNRGNQTFKTIRYGSGISDYNQSLTNTDNYSVVLGYAVFSRTDTVSGSAKKNIYVESDIFPTGDIPAFSFFSKALTIDFSNKFDKDRYDASTEAGREEIKTRLNTLTQNYVNSKSTKLSELKVNIKITEQNELNKLQNVGLCDKVRVSYGAAGLTLESVKVSKVVYDCLNERYLEHELGEKKLNLSNYLKKSYRR